MSDLASPDRGLRSPRPALLGSSDAPAESPKFAPEPRAYAPFQPVPGSSGYGRVLGTFRPHFLPVFSSPSLGGSLGGRSGPWRHLRTLLSPVPCSHPSALPGAGPAFPPHLPRCWPRPVSARSHSRTLTAPLWPWPVHPLGLSHPRRHQAVLNAQQSCLAVCSDYAEPTGLTSGGWCAEAHAHT